MPQTAYCSHNDISNFLGIDSFTTDKGLVVDDLINTNEDIIDRRTMNAFRETTVTNETHNVDTQFRWRFGKAVYLNNRGIKDGSVTVNVFNGSSWEDWGSEGSAFTVNNEEGVVYIRGFWYWTEQDMIMKVSYTFGETSVPKDIKKACVLLTAIDLVSNENIWFNLPSGADSVNLNQKIDIWQKKVDRILEDRNEIKILIW